MPKKRTPPKSDEINPTSEISQKEIFREISEWNYNQYKSKNMRYEILDGAIMGAVVRLKKKRVIKDP